MLIEHQQALYRGGSWNWPTEIWSCAKQQWQPYKGDVPKDGTWGTIVAPEKAKIYMRRF